MAARGPGHAVVVDGSVAVFCLDSMAEVGGEHAGQVVISGSHGGPSAARYALAARPLLSAFNDAGIGKDGAGISGLALLQANGLAALAVAHTSARIGEARSTLEDGVITHVNAAAAALGARAGETLLDWLQRRLGVPPAALKAAAAGSSPGRR